MNSSTRRFLIDAAERVACTFAEAAAATIIGSTVFNFSTAKAAAISGMVAVASLVKVTAAAQLGRKDSAALLPASVDPA